MVSKPNDETESSINNTLDGKPDVSLIDKQQWNYLLRLYRLSPREFEVASLICCGQTTLEIAEYLNVKPSTVKTHIKNILIKTRTRNKIAFVLKAITDAIAFSDESRKAPRINIVEMKRKTKKTSTPTKKTPQRKLL
ncbi:MAG: helix-turn-helix transcriptional regulator [Planctomycetota bacterium]|jgi:DNA-binding NarL/FixJ family response regulator